MIGVFGSYFQPPKEKIVLWVVGGGGLPTPFGTESPLTILHLSTAMRSPFNLCLHVDIAEKIEDKSEGMTAY